MKYLLDTCVISEFTKPQPDQHVVQWLKLIPLQQLYISALTLGEIQKGISQLEVSLRQQKLQTWLDHDIPVQFTQRVLTLDEQTGRFWGQLCGQYGRRGRKLPVIDSLLAATAMTSQMVLVTRNEKDFSMIEGLQLFNPWALKDI